MDSANKGYWGRGSRRSRGLKILSVGMFATLFTLSLAPPSYSSSVYSGSSVGTNGTVYGWCVTDAPPPPGFAMVHTAYVRTTLTSPNGRTAYSGTRTGPDTVRADVSLAYDPNDLGTYNLQSTHGAWCPVWQRWIIPLWVPKTSSSKTVPYVILTLRNSGPVSFDNSGANGYSFYNGTNSLGVFYFNGGQAGPDFAGWRTGVEIVGIVLPTSFSGLIYFERIYEAKVYEDFTEIANYPPGTVDPFDVDPLHPVSDYNPQSGGSQGTIYDLDAPWLGTGTYPPGTVVRKRVNFIQHAFIYRGLTKVRVSGYLNWFSRLSVYKNGSYSDVLEQTYGGDNMAGAGTTKLSYNLQ